MCIRDSSKEWAALEANKPHMNKVEELVERGKAKGVLTYKEVMDTLEAVSYTHLPALPCRA